MLLVLVYVRVRGFEERGGRLHRCVRRFDRPIALQAGDCHLGFDRSSHSTSSGEQFNLNLGYTLMALWREVLGQFAK